MHRTALCVDLERRRKGPIYPVIVAGEPAHISGLSPFAPETGTKA
jgi:2-iminobutanoate/2-iminopropanoate deaminase